MFNIFFDFVAMPGNHPRALADTLEHSLRVLEASRKLPDHFREKSKFHEKCHFSGACPGPILQEGFLSNA